MELIAVFDFDGTLIKKDSMMLFFKRYFGLSWKNIPAFARLLFESIKFLLGLYSRKQFKEKYINLILGASKIKDLDELGNDFSDFLLEHVLPDAKKEINRLKESGHECILLSASPDFYLRKVKDELGFSMLICTKTRMEDGELLVSGRNCYGENKIKKLLSEYGSNINWKDSYCFSDHSSDIELLSLFGNAFIVNNAKIVHEDIKTMVWN